MRTPRAFGEHTPPACAFQRPAEEIVSRTDLFLPIRRARPRSISTSCEILQRSLCCERALDRGGNQLATPRQSAILWSMNHVVVGQPSWLPVLRASLPAVRLSGRDAARTGRRDACPTCLPRFKVPMRAINRGSARGSRAAVGGPPTASAYLRGFLAPFFA